MANLSRVIYINEVDYSTLLNGGTITKGGVTYSHDPTALYVIKDVSAPEYAETAGYATTAGQATKAIQDGGGNVISETYEKEQQVIIEFEISGNGIIFTNLEDSEVREICNDSSKTVLLMDVGNPGMDNECAVYYRSVFATDYWIFSSTSTMRGGGNIIVFYWDDNHEIINLRSSSDLFPTENVDFGQAYGISSNNANLAARTSSISEFELKKGGIVAIKFTTDIDITNPSLNISSTGSKPIYYRGSALSGGTVNAGDTVTFIYDGTYYHIISIDKDIPAPATTAPIMDGTATIGTSDKYAKEDHVHPSDTSKANVADLATVATSGSYNDLTDKPTIPTAITVDSTITQNGTNPVQGGAIYSALTDKANINGSVDEVFNASTLQVCSNDEGVMMNAIYSDDEMRLLFTESVDGGSLNYTFDGSAKTIATTADIASCVPTTRKINNKPLSSDITLNASDVGANVFVVNIESDGNDGGTCNKTNAEIYAAWQAGREIIATDGEFICQLCGIPSSTNAIFMGLYDDGDTYISQIIVNTRNNTQSVSIDIFYVLSNSAPCASITSAKITEWNGKQDALVSGTNIKTINNQSLLGSGNLTPSQLGIPDALKSGSVAGKLYCDNVGGSGNFSISGNSGCIPNLTAGTFLVSIYAKSTTQSYTFRFNFGSSVTYDLSTTNGEISDVRQITIPSSGTFSGSVLNSSVASGTILYVVMYNYLTPVSTVGVAAVTNQYSDLDGTPTITPVNNGTLTIQQNEITVGTFTANQSSNTTANIYSTMFGTLGQSGFERDNYNSIGGWAGVETVTPNPLVTYVDILSNKLYRYDPLTSRYIELSEGDLSTITSTAITDLTDIL